MWSGGGGGGLAAGGRATGGDGKAGGVPVAVCQFAPRPGDVRANLAQAVALVEVAAARGARLIVLPELCLTGYYMSAVFRSLAEPLDGPQVGVLRELARRRGVLVAAGVAERGEGEALHDTAVLVGPAGVLGAARKARLWDREVGLFTPGDGRPAVVPTGLGPLALMVCYDLEHPELAAAAAAAGAGAIVAPAAFSDPVLWRATLRSRAQETGLPVVAANRTGVEGNARFCGASMVVGPDGTVLAEAGARQGVRVARVQIAAAGRRRRPDARMVYPEYG